LYDDDAANVKRGELFLNEPKAQIFYVGADGIARRVGEQDVVPFAQIDFTGLREFADDTAAQSEACTAREAPSRCGFLS
jgi:hypothetical protein